MNATITTSECPKCGGPMTIARNDARWSAAACKACRDLARRAAFSARRAGTVASAAKARRRVNRPSRRAGGTKHP